MRGEGWGSKESLYSMVRVLVIGGTGYIGQEICLSLRRDGHRVFALARTPDKALKLAVNEAFVIRGSAMDSAKYAAAIENYSIDVVVDVIGTPATTDQILGGILDVAQRRVQARACKLGYIYISGIWVYGNSYLPSEDLDEFKPDRNVPRIAEWRRETEEQVLSMRDYLDVLILRPGIVYGRSGTTWTAMFKPLLEATKNEQEEVILDFDATTMMPIVHVDDVAQGVVKGVEAVNNLSPSTHPVFDLVSSYESLSAIVRLAGQVFGFGGRIILNDPPHESAWHCALSTSVNADSHRAKQLLGWNPTRMGMAADIDIYVSSWSASN